MWENFDEIYKNLSVIGESFRKNFKIILRNLENFLEIQRKIRVKNMMLQIIRKFRDSLKNMFYQFQLFL